MSQDETAHDAIVIGAGPAGSVAAALLARAGWSVALVEKAEFPRRKVCGEFLSPTNHPLFAELGVAEAISRAAGPEIRRMALLARNATLTAAMPRPPQGAQGWGRALGRETLDTLLRDRAIAAGATLYQPWSVIARSHDGALHRCTLTRRNQTAALAAPIVIDATGAGAPAPHRASDLLGFKAHFHDAALPPDLMPVVVFPGGYGGIVTTSEHRVTFGCCIRRDAIKAARAAPGAPASAAAAVLAAIMRDSRGVSDILGGATLAGPWLATGPIAPGIRPRYESGLFRAGTAAGETHPLVGEGMSMAMQAAWLLATTLTRDGDIPAAARLDQLGRIYAAAWRRRFAPRIAAAALFANLAMRRTTVSLLLPVLTHLPGLLTYGAARSGKTRMVVGYGA